MGCCTSPCTASIKIWRIFTLFLLLSSLSIVKNSILHNSTSKDLNSTNSIYPDLQSPVWHNRDRALLDFEVDVPREEKKMQSRYHIPSVRQRKKGFSPIPVLQNLTFLYPSKAVYSPRHHVRSCCTFCFPYACWRQIFPSYYNMKPVTVTLALFIWQATYWKGFELYYDFWARAFSSDSSIAIKTKDFSALTWRPIPAGPFISSFWFGPE